MVKKSFIGLSSIVGCILLGVYALTGCQTHEGSEEQLKEDVDSFATNYFNWHFPEALKYCTLQSERWLKYAASNVHEADVEQLRQKEEDATVKIGDIDYGDDEVSATVEVIVHNFLQMDSIGQEAHPVRQATFLLPMEIEDGKWKIKLSGLPAH